MRSFYRLGISAPLLLVGLALLVPASASASVEVQAHRGGANIDGKAAFPENSMAAFKYSLKKGYTIEFDLQSTSDHVAVVMHDEELDRTSTCTGLIEEKTLAQLDPCRLDVKGFGDVAVDLPGADAVQPIPRLTQVIDLLERTGGRANIEVKNLAGTFPEFPPDVYRQLEASDIPSSRITVQNFKTVDLEKAHDLYPGVTTSYLTLDFLNPFAVTTAVANKFDQVSPQFPITADFVSDARAAGLTIAPFTLDTADEMKAADALGVDSIITNDPTLAGRLVGARPSLRLSLVKGPKRKRPGGKIRIGAFAFNAGKGLSDPGARVKINFNRKSLKPVGRVSKVLPALKQDEEYDTNFRVRVRRGAKKFGKFPIRFRLIQAGKRTIKKVYMVKVLRPRK